MQQISLLNQHTKLDAFKTRINSTWYHEAASRSKRYAETEQILVERKLGDKSVSERTNLTLCVVVGH